MVLDKYVIINFHAALEDSLSRHQPSPWGAGVELGWMGGWRNSTELVRGRRPGAYEAGPAGGANGTRRGGWVG
jgi:hypothetical protein